MPFQKGLKFLKNIEKDFEALPKAEQDRTN